MKIEKIEILDEDNNSVSSGNQEIFLCDSCPENFRTESQLQKHFRAKHDNQSKTQGMNGGGGGSDTNNHQSRGQGHAANKTQDQVKQTGKFECEICSVKFMKVCNDACSIAPSAFSGQK